MHLALMAAVFCPRASRLLPFEMGYGTSSTCTLRTILH